MAQSLYDAIGVSPSATQEEIEAACIRLGEELNPAKNSGNLQAVIRFKEIEKAYEILGNSELRQQYDAASASPENADGKNIQSVSIGQSKRSQDRPRAHSLLSSSKLKTCKVCNAQISENAFKCPQCGDRNISTAHAVVSLVAFLGVIWFLFGNGIENIVAKDMLDQYRLAKKSGDNIAICVHAGLVAAGYNQAKDEKNYLKWKAIERSDCHAAGISK